MGLTVTDLVNAVSAQNVVNPAGTIGGEPAPPGRQLTYTVRARGRLMSAEEFGNIIVRANPDGSLVRLRDVARIELGVENYNMQAYTNGAPAALIALYQVPGSNALDAANHAKATMARLAERFPGDMEVGLTLDTTVPVTEGAKEILITLAEAIGLVLIVVFVFLQSFRATWVPIQTIPVSLIGTFLFFPMVGFTINTLSLLGLVLAVGLVVDDAIVVVEAVQAKIDEGLSPRDAVIAAMDEVGGALVGIALVLSSVFIPASFILGITGRLYRQFALTIAFSVLLSAVNALTYKPAQCALILRPRRQDAPHGLLGRFFGGFERVFASAQEGYVRGSHVLIRAWNGMSYQESIAGSGVGIFALSLVVVFLILAALYHSWSLPWSVLLSTPVAAAGAFVGFWARGLENNGRDAGRARPSGPAGTGGLMIRRASSGD